MSGKKGPVKYLILLLLMAIFLFGIVYGGIWLTKNIGKSNEVISRESAEEKLGKLVNEINVSTSTARKESIDLSTPDIKEMLPDISKYPAQVENTTDDYIEIFSSVEKTGKGKDGWLVDVANEFNSSNVEINGKEVSVKIRGLSSGEGMDYIVSGKYIPDAYTPSNELWGEMMKSKGTNVNLESERLIGNVPGIILSKLKYDELIKKYGSINLKNITEAVANNEIAMGYTNPLASATGLNFLISTLYTFDGSNPLSSTAISGFEEFQNNIPFVSFTTLQMRSAAESGALDGFIMEYQTYNNAPDIKSNYVFTPFGVRHDSPIYSMENITNDKKEILEKFIQFCKNDKSQSLATEYGFNQNNDYKAEIPLLDGDTIIQAQKLWKEKKNGNKSIAAIFVADVSGSMDGQPLNELKKSLINASKYIGKENSIGLVTYSDDVSINLPISKFDVNQRSLFTGAVNDMQAGGGTATFDAILVATKMLMEEKIKNPDAKLMLFVLSDGETNRGYALNDIEGILKTLKIPVHTIGYNANIQALESISGINEAANINADSDDVVYKLGSLFNAEM